MLSAGAKAPNLRQKNKRQHNEMPMWQNINETPISDGTIQHLELVREQ